MLAAEQLNFSCEKVFSVFRENLTKCDGKTKNLIDCKDDIIFAWDNKQKILLTQNLKILEDDPPVYQELSPTEPPLTDVHFIRVNSTVTKAVLWGPNGAAVIDIPKRWGSRGSFQGGKEVIITRCRSIEDRYFTVQNIEIRQIRFHPGSPRDNHVVLLTSDNSLRLYLLPIDRGYDQNLSDPELIHVWSLGQSPLNLSGRMAFLVSLGDTAVDFDFALPILDEEGSADIGEATPDRILWPVLVLRGNGDVCILNTSLTSNTSLQFRGPLPIYPPADDNYGVDACSILVMPTVPTVVVLATSSGTVYHTVLLGTSKEESQAMQMASYALYVLESVELELGIQLNDEDASYTCPVSLHADLTSRWKYYCTHNTGIHAVFMSFVPQIERFIDLSDGEDFRFDQTPSTVEYLVCTRTNMTPASPILGFAIGKPWNVILSVLSNGDVISLPLKMADIVLNVEHPSEDVAGDETTPLKKLLKEPFDLHIRNLLKRNVNQPVLKLDKNVELPPQECLDLVTRTTNILRQEYFTKMELVKDEIELRAGTLSALKELQLRELSELEEKRPELQSAAERLTERYEEAKETHQQLVRRIEAILLAVKKMEPIESLAEKKMKNELIAVEEKVETYEKSIKRLREKLDYQRFKITEHRSERKKSMHIDDNQLEIIKKNLLRASGEIANLISILNNIKRELDSNSVDLRSPYK